MFTRIFGASAVVAGICALVFSVYAAVRAPSMADTLIIAANAGVIDLDAADWIARWRASCLVMGVLGAVAIAGGGMILIGKPRGFLLVAAVALSLAVLPWIGEALGLARYAFERGSIVESFVEGAAAAAALVAWGRSRRVAA